MNIKNLGYPYEWDLSLRCCPFVIRIVSTMQVHMSIVGRLMPCELLQVDKTNKASWFPTSLFFSAHLCRTNHSCSDCIVVRYISDIEAYLGMFLVLFPLDKAVSKNALSWREIDKDRDYL